MLAGTAPAVRNDRLQRGRESWSGVGVRPVKGHRVRVGAAQHEAGRGERAAAFSRKT